MTQESKLSIVGMYEKRSAKFGPATYGSEEFQKKILIAASSDIPHPPLRVLDLMSGAGLLGKALQKWTPDDDFYYLDLSAKQLKTIKDKNPDNFHDALVQGDARLMPFRENVFSVGIVRYAAKDIPQDQQPALFDQMYDVTAPGGVWVLADMYAPVGRTEMQTEQIYEWLNYQHAAKQERGGRDRNTEGTCHIPTEEGWLKLFRESGFRADAVDHYMSYVTTTDWLNSNQVTVSQLEELNHMILTAPKAAQKAFKIRGKDGSVQLNYPVTIIRAVKP